MSPRLWFTAVRQWLTDLVRFREPHQSSVVAKFKDTMPDLQRKTPIPVIRATVVRKPVSFAEWSARYDKEKAS